MIKNILFFLLVIFCQNLFAGPIENNFNEALNQVSNLNSDNCVAVLSKIQKNFENIQESPYLRMESEASVESLRAQLFLFRQELRTQISKNISCAKPIKEALISARALEDLTGLYGYKDKQLEFENVNFNNQAIPLKNQKAYHSHHGSKEINFNSGDIMITKGISYISSAISTLPTPSSLFSHIVFVHVDQTNQAASTYESYIGSGASIYNMDTALKNENVRILVLRQSDTDLAKKADEYMTGRFSEAKRSGHQIPYDYEMDFNDNSKLSCEEIAYDAYKVASEDKFILPAFPSYNSRDRVSIMESMGLKKGEIMMPADMESDPRFEVIYDWTDFRFIRDSWRKDAILSEIFRWMDDLNYQFKTHLFDVPRNAFLLARYVPGLSWVFNKIQKIDSDLPNSAILAKLNIQTVGEILMQKLKANDEAHFKETGLWLSQKQLRNSLEKIRLQDLAKHRTPEQSSTFHDYISNQPPAYKTLH